jgi:hypothetical protein
MARYESHVVCNSCIWGHLSEGIRKRLRNKNTDLVVVRSEPLDVSVNKPFNHLVRKHYDACMLTYSDKIKKVSQ